MKGYFEFIVHIPNKHNDTIDTNSGVKIYADKRFSSKRTANNVVEVVEVPVKNKTCIKKGYLLFVDPTILLNQVYSKTGEQESIYLVDREKSLFRIPENLILMYQKNINEEWIGFDENLLCDYPTQEKPKEKVLESGIIIPIKSKQKKTTPRFSVVYNNKESGIETGEKVVVKTDMVVDVWFNSKKYAWLRNKDVLGIAI